MLLNSSQTVEFIGGPFDGHLETIQNDAGPLPAQLVCFISQNTFRHLNGLSHDVDCGFTSVAIYNLVVSHSMSIYLFVAAVAPEQIEIVSTSGENEKKN